MEKSNVLEARTMSAIEFQGVMAGKIPVCDEFGEFNSYGLNVVKKAGLFGVASTELRLVIPIEYNAVRLLDNGYILVQNSNGYFLRTKAGVPLLHPIFESEEAAIQYANSL